MITIEAENLSIHRAKKPVVKNLSFAVQRGEVFGLLGGNGAGKSTTLLAFLGFLSAAGGSAKINGVGVELDTSAARRSIAYLPVSLWLFYGGLLFYCWMNRLRAWIPWPSMSLINL